MLGQTSRLSLLISVAYSWTRESGHMRIKVCQGLLLISLEEFDADREQCAVSSPSQVTAGGFEGLPRPVNDLSGKASTLHW